MDNTENYMCMCVCVYTSGNGESLSEYHNLIILEIFNLVIKNNIVRLDWYQLWYTDILWLSVEMSRPLEHITPYYCGPSYKYHRSHVGRNYLVYFHGPDWS